MTHSVAASNLKRDMTGPQSYQPAQDPDLKDILDVSPGTVFFDCSVSAPSRLATSCPSSATQLDVHSSLSSPARSVTRLPCSKWLERLERAIAKAVCVIKPSFRRRGQLLKVVANSCAAHGPQTSQQLSIVGLEAKDTPGAGCCLSWHANEVDTWRKRCLVFNDGSQVDFVVHVDYWPCQYLVFPG